MVVNIFDKPVIELLQKHGIYEAFREASEVLGKHATKMKTINEAIEALSFRFKGFRTLRILFYNIECFRMKDNIKTRSAFYS